jgi:hypothetical protein
MTDISDDAPLRLKDAVKIAFPSGGMTVSGLRREHANGRLEIESIAGKQFVTLRAIREMRERCKVAAPTYGKLPPRRDGAPTRKPGIIYASDIPEEIMQEARANSIRNRIEKVKKEERERKRREGYRVLRRD